MLSVSLAVFLFHAGAEVVTTFSAVAQRLTPTAPVV